VNASICARHIRPIPGQPWRKIINGPSAGPASQNRVVWRGERNLRAVSRVIIETPLH
jgi:hypothetical protein